MISEQVLRQLLEIILNDTSGTDYGSDSTIECLMELARNTKFKGVIE